MELTFLGTGAGMPAKHRNVTSIAIKHLYDGSVWLFDCGEATQHQILHTSIKPRKIDKIFITHLHGDHIFGLPGLLGSRSFLEGTEPLHVYGPDGIRDFIETSLKISGTHLKYDLHIHEIDEGIVYEDDRLLICAKKLDHAILSFGYRVVEKDKPGPLLVEKLKREGIMPGPIYKQLKNGETVQLEDGRTISGFDYVGSSKKGRILTVLGDTRFCESSINLAKDADILVHEATFDKRSEEIAHQYFHSTTVQAAKVAFQAGVKKLFITHISSRYEKKDWPILEQEAKEIFPDTEIAYDLKVVHL
ncbi:ribonuclease Z [Fervidibacillus albus]|uniref:Ribonuclease Z n=1 Tax=Fervidibacillus albus TaxID=2980026 RepID=A0A9E8RWN5_9BACI|nr:ribonuclease Z [Fervidibacillus albus]WAA10484.1 ribonuclease Z [Fervidibacillus albus]